MRFNPFYRFAVRDAVAAWPYNATDTSWHCNYKQFNAAPVCFTIFNQAAVFAVGVRDHIRTPFFVGVPALSRRDGCPSSFCPSFIRPDINDSRAAQMRDSLYVRLVHNLHSTHSPAFSRLDISSCRDLLMPTQAGLLSDLNP
jgi:hypothetical protein